MSSRGINKVILIGNLGQEPEIRYMPNGGAVTKITLATSENWRDKQTGEIKEKTEWHRVVLFGKIAEVAGEYLHKGSQVYIEGSLQTRKWQDQNGQDRYTTEVVVNIGGNMQMIGNRQNTTHTTTTNVIQEEGSQLHHVKRGNKTPLQLRREIGNINTPGGVRASSSSSGDKDPIINFDDDDIPF